MMAGRTLLITNDFPPRAGGIQQFVYNLAVRSAPGSLVAYASRWKDWEKFDAEAPFVLVGMTFLAPALTAHGLPGVLLQKLIQRGACMLDGDAAVDVDVPPDAACTQFPANESREPARTRLAWIGARHSA